MISLVCRVRWRLWGAPTCRQDAQAWSACIARGWAWLWAARESQPVVCWENEGVLCPSIRKVPTSPQHPTHAQAASQPHSKTRTCWGHTHSQTSWQKRPHSWNCWCILNRPQVQGSCIRLLKAIILSSGAAQPSDVPRPPLQRGRDWLRTHSWR